MAIPFVAYCLMYTATERFYEILFSQNGLIVNVPGTRRCLSCHHFTLTFSPLLGEDLSKNVWIESIGHGKRYEYCRSLSGEVDAWVVSTLSLRSGRLLYESWVRSNIESVSGRWKISIKGRSVVKNSIHCVLSLSSTSMCDGRCMKRSHISIPQSIILNWTTVDI